MQVLDDGSLKPKLGFRSCHRLRMALATFDTKLPLVAYSSADIDKPTTQALLKAFRVDECPNLAPLRAALDRIALSSANPSASVRCVGASCAVHADQANKYTGSALHL